MSSLLASCLFTLFLSLLHFTCSVDKGNFKTCDQSGFCKRSRVVSPGSAHYSVTPDSLIIEDHGCKMDIVNQRNGVVLTAELYSLDDNMFRVKINEKNPLRRRYEVEGSLVGDPKLIKCRTQRSSDGVVVTAGTSEAAVTFDPFKIDLSVNGEIAVMLNSRGLLNFEHYRMKKSSMPTPSETENKEEGEEPKAQETGVSNEEGKEEEVKQEEEDDGEGAWEETFKTHHDSKPYGPSSVSMDVSFPGVEHVYGIPEHADNFLLKTTNDGDPYRLFNLDVFEYELNSKMALYGSIPVMLAHNWSKTIGIFWHNAAETWVDITSSTANQNILGKLMSMFKSSDEVPQTDTRWVSESGIIDIFIILGPRPHDVFRQYSSLTGRPTLPPLFGLGYHQCRWNYNDEKDVENVDMQLDKNDMPYDVLWLDIEHTDGKKYFTWDSSKFPSPADMQNKLASKGRKMVTIIDPHIKREAGYHIHKEADEKGLYVKKADGSVYEGWCWPGTSSWIDFVSPDNRKWWSERFALENYQGSTLNLFTWNDMNEPSVFNGPEITMHKDAKHYGDWEHRDLHNIYGMLQHRATFEGHLMRSGYKERPFVLSRAFFAGTQRYGAIWTGDNLASWDHLRASFPMIMSVGVAGLPFVGADVGGFFKDPNQELVTRWYQAGIFYPFFRAHAHIDTKRREPYLMDEENRNVIREALRLRYKLLPYWYTLFYYSHLTGMPVARPLWLEFPRDKNTYNIEDQMMIGSALMVRPVMDEGGTYVQLYLPGTNTVWYDYDDHTPHNGGRRQHVTAPLSKIPLFLRGGHIVPTKQRVRRSSSLSHDDPYTLLVPLDNQGKAKGLLYVDDGHSTDYQKGKFLLRDFTFENNQLTSQSGDPNGQFESKAWIERVVVIGYPKKPNTVTFKKGGVIRFSYSASTKVLTIGKPDVNVANDFTILIE